MAKKKKYYVVWEGNETGVFDSWAKCLLQVKGYPNAKYKAFEDMDVAYDAFYSGTYSNFTQKKATKTIVSEKARKEIVWESMAVDAACSGNPGDMEYRGVDTKTGVEFFRVGPLKKGTNNVGEFLALVHALALLQREGKPNLPIYSDSKIAMGWVARKKPNTKLARLPSNKPIFDLMARATKWLQNNTYENEIMKWKTKEWGEIPADFGRK